MAEITKPGRPGIDEQQYTVQLQEWLNEGIRLVDITATALQKAVGGQYKKAAEILERFKEGYETRELTELPPVPDKLQALLNTVGLEMWRIVTDEKRTELAEAFDVFEVEKRQLQVLADERLERIDALENNEAELLARVEQLQQQLTEKADAWHQLKAANEGLSARNAELKERVQEKAQRIEHLEPQLDKQTSANIELSSQLKDKQQDLGRALGELKQLKAVAAEATSFAAKAKQDAVKLEQQAVVLQQKLDISSEINAAAEAELKAELREREKMVAQLASKTTEAEQSSKAAAALQKQLDKLQAELVAIAKKAK